MSNYSASWLMLAAGFLLGAGVARASLSGYNFTTIDDPSAQYFPQTIAVGLNNTGSVVGYYSTSASGYNGFLYSGAAFTNFSDTYEQFGNEINST